MGTYREAVLHARRGGTARLGGKEIRFLTFEEAEPIILEQCPSRATRIDSKTGKAAIKNGKIIVDTFADPKLDLKRFGLYDVGVHPAVQLATSDEDIYLPVELDEDGKEKPRALRTDWEILKDGAAPEEPAVIDPEAVDEALHETDPPPETL
jgi:hypothetical protein